MAIIGVISSPEASNEGDCRPIKFDIQLGVVISSQRSAPVDSSGYVCIAAYELYMHVMSGAVSERYIAVGVTHCMPIISRFDSRDGRPFILSNSFVYGMGASSINVMDAILNLRTEVVKICYSLHAERFGLHSKVSRHGEYHVDASNYHDYRVLEE